MGFRLHAQRTHAFTLAALTSQPETLSSHLMSGVLAAAVSPCRRLTLKEPAAGNGATLSRRLGCVAWQMLCCLAGACGSWQVG